MPFCNGIDELLVSAVLFEALLNFRMRGARSLKIALVHYHDIRQIEHHDLLLLQPAAVIGIHYQDR